MIDKQVLKKELKRVKKYENKGSILFGTATVLIVFLSLFFVSQKYLSVVDLRSFFLDSQSSLYEPQSSPVQLLQSEIPSTARIYTVQRGEGLWQIAMKQYGDASKYLLIYEANRDIMQTPEDIFEGMELKIP